MKTPFSIIVAVDESFGIGRHNSLPWNLPGDMKHFKEVTMGEPGLRQNMVIMGRKTWESIPSKFRPLSGRINCVLTRDINLPLPAQVVKATDFQTSLDKALNNRDVREIFVIGGAELFTTAIAHPNCEKLYITHILASFECDRFFPPLPNSFRETSRSPIHQEASLSYFFSIYSRF